MVGELVMGRFRVLERVGSGGMGTVYRAFDERLQRQVAVKEIAGADARRVLREAQAAARLNHPGIVTLYELGSERDGARSWSASWSTARPWRSWPSAGISAIARSPSSARTSARRSPTRTSAA